ncbi:MAG: aspartate kinase, homoserine dehydrogenase [Gammaproteobacteria bacterium]|nr:aspartate kinase, homoserine dehydrogenase [Gammaproteobacteria bacterium]
MNIEKIALSKNSVGRTPKIAVIKFGASVLSEIEDIPKAVHEVYYYLRRGYKVLVVISAIGDTTDQLNYAAQIVMDDETGVPLTEEFAELLATGETNAACLFTISLDRVGIAAKKIHHQCLTTQGSILNATPKSLDKDIIFRLFARYSVLVLPGSIGCNTDKHTTLLGRGGSDFTALFIASRLKADICVFYKDTDGIYDRDPNTEKDVARRYALLNYTDAFKIPEGVIQHKALKFAQAKQIPFCVKSLVNTYATLVSSQPSSFSSIKNRHRHKLRVVLCGLGTVGLGIYKHLINHHELFEVVGVVVNDLEKNTRHQLPDGLISNDWKAVLARGCHVVIELIGGIEIPEAIIKRSLIQGCHVITANKALIAEKGLALSELAAQNKVQLLYSAAVGGAIPILENLRHLKNSTQTSQITSITAVLNGTCNFVLDKVNEGKTIQDAVHLAKILGFAESDPDYDLNGLDAQQKTHLISRIAFGKDPDNLEVAGIQHLNEQIIRSAKKKGKVIRLVASCELEKNDRVRAKISPIELDLTHPLAQVSGEENSILVHTANDKVIQWRGKGAGRWPTAESVFADLLDLSLCLRDQPPLSDRIRNFDTVAEEA